MWNELLKKIDKSKIPKEAIGLWNGDTTSLSFINEGINMVYRFNDNYKNYYLRITNSALRSKKELLAATEFQKFLFYNKVNVCELVSSKNNHYVEEIQQNDQVFLAQVCREVPGLPINHEFSDINLYWLWGKELGLLHQAAIGFNPKEHEYASWEKSFVEMDDYVKQEPEIIKNLLYSLKNYYFQREKNNLNFGLTHGDHREANVITDGQQINFIDFDLPCSNWFLEDVARPFFNNIIDNNPCWKDKFFPYLDGYFSIMPKESIQLDDFVKQVQVKALEIYLWTKNNWNDEIAPGGRNAQLWLERIYQKLSTSNWQEELMLWISQYRK